MSATNLEEAATVASEFISSEPSPTSSVIEDRLLLIIFSLGLDNLPAEVAHLLAELKHRDARAQGALICLAEFQANCPASYVERTY